MLSAKWLFLPKHMWPESLGQTKKKEEKKGGQRNIICSRRLRIPIQRLKQKCLHFDENFVNGCIGCSLVVNWNGNVIWWNFRHWLQTIVVILLASLQWNFSSKWLIRFGDLLITSDAMPKTSPNIIFKWHLRFFNDLTLELLGMLSKGTFQSRPR